ncbi:ATP-binding protein [Falsiruegeria mediterranea]
MRLMPQTLTQQFLFLMVGVVMLTQVLMLGTLLIETDGKVDQYERTFVYGRIASVFNSSQHMSPVERVEFYETVSNPDIFFSLRDTGDGIPIRESKNEDLVGLQEFIDATIMVHEVPVTFWDVVKFWYTDAEDNCFIRFSQDLDIDGCPYWRVSIQYDDGIWLSADGPPSPEAPVLLAPVLMSFILTICALVVVVALVARRLTRPLRQLSHAADQVGRGEDIERLPETGPQELATVMQAFNTMQDRTRRYIKDRTTMLAAISHDLRTPITSLRLRAEFIEDPTLQGKVIETLDDMQTMVESFLTFAKQDIAAEPQQQFDLVELLRDMALEVDEMTFSSAVKSCPYHGGKVSLGRALANLVANAIKYGEVAKVTLEANDQHIRITVDDTGPGVPENRLEDIFTPFTRLDTARSVVEGSVGLGLSIARSIARKQGGDIQPSNQPSGFRMILTLPN